MINLVVGGISFLFCMFSCFSVLGFGCSAVLVLFCCCCCCCCIVVVVVVVLVCWLLLVVVDCCCFVVVFCYHVVMLVLVFLFFVVVFCCFFCVCCFVFVVMFLSLLFLLFVCSRTTQQMNKKTTKTLVSFCCLPFGFAQREANNLKQNIKGLFHSSFVSHPCCVFIIFVLHFHFLSFFFGFCLSFVSFLPFSFVFH